MFKNCELLSHLDLSNFKINKVESMKGMFYGCSSLDKLNLSGFDINNMSNINMDGMFYGCPSNIILEIRELFPNMKNEAFKFIEDNEEEEEDEI